MTIAFTQPHSLKKIDLHDHINPQALAVDQVNCEVFAWFDADLSYAVQLTLPCNYV
jgi:hypothetical protein